MNKELRILISEMKRKNLTVEARKIEQIVGEKKEYYQDIVFLQREDAFDSFEGGVDGFFDADENEQFNYLMQWESGEGEILDQEPWGTADDVEKIERGGETYYMSLNSGLGTAGLDRLVPESEYSDLDITPEED